MLQVDGKPIQAVDKHKFLGVIIDDRLRFQPHIDDLCNKLSRVVGMTRSLAPYVPVRILKNLYFSLFYSQMTYCISAWASAPKSLLQKPNNLMNRIVKLCNPNCIDISLSFNVLKLLTFEDCYKYFVLVNTFKFIKCHSDHSYFNGRIQSLQLPYHHATRLNNSNYRYSLPSYFKTKTQSSFLYRGIKYWNELPGDLIEIQSLALFKKLLKSHLLS